MNYLQSGGIEITNLFGRGHWAADTAKLTFEDRLQLAMDVVFTNYNTEVWNNLVRTRVIPPIQGWGRMLATI